MCGTLRLLPIRRLSHSLDVPGDHVPWGDGELELFWELLPALPLHRWVLGVRFSPSAFGASADVAEQNPPGRAEFVP